MPPGVDATKVTSCQIIIPQKQCIVKRNSDIFISVLSYSHQVTPKHKVVAIVSTRVETEDYHKELDAGIRILGKVVERFDYVEDCYAPANGGGEQDKCYITSSYDASSHFETTTADVLDIYKRVMGEDLDVEGMQKAAAAEQQGK